MYYVVKILSLITVCFIMFLRSDDIMEYRTILIVYTPLDIASANVAPAEIRREVATSRTILRARGKPELPLLTDIDFHPRPRLKSRRPIWSNRPDEAQTIQHLLVW